MRGILFRAKCTDESSLKGQWLEGQILHDGVAGKYYIHRDNCLNESDNVGEEGLLRFVAYEIDPETACQYTGLADKDGRKIFEGDIVKHFYDPKIPSKVDEGIISWDGSECGFHRSSREDNCFYKITDHCKYEVIGNIFDNPELTGKR